MNLEISKFMPAEMRIQMARELIKEEGIRPLARRIGVNPKTIYKYKEGSAHPRDETLARIMRTMKEEDPDLFERYLERLRASFLDALDSSHLHEKSRKERKGERRPKIVGQKPTEGEISLGEICDRMEITSSFECTKLGRVLGVVKGEPGLTSEEIARRSGLSPDAVERYTEMLVADGLFRESSPDHFKLTRPVRLEE